MLTFIDPVDQLQELCNYVDVSDINALGNSNVSCLHCNVRSVFKNFSKFYDMLQESSLMFDFLVLTETLCSRDSAGLFPLASYSQFDFPRLSKSKKRGGGIFLYVHEHYSVGSVQWSYSNYVSTFQHGSGCCT